MLTLQKKSVFRCFYKIIKIIIIYFQGIKTIK